MRRILSLSLAALTLSPLAAHADALRVFDVSATLDPNTGTGGSISGTITIDPTAGDVTSSSLTSTYGANKYSVSSSESTAYTTHGHLVILTFGSIGDATDAFLSLVLPTTTLVNYGGSTVCNDVARCSEGATSNYSSSYFAPNAQFGDGLSSGQLALHVDPVPPTPIAATPEPSSIALLGNGVLSAAGILRKRAHLVGRS